MKSFNATFVKPNPEVQIICPKVCRNCGISLIQVVPIEVNYPRERKDVANKDTDVDIDRYYARTTKSK